MKRIVLFGPPGCGKTTIIRLLNNKKYSAIDVEDLGNTYDERRQNFLIAVSHENNFTFYGGADLKLNDLPVGSTTVLICPSDKVKYLERVEERNRIVSHKAGQNEEDVYNWFYNNRDKFDHYIDNTTTPENTLVDVLSLSKKLL